jgi:FkbM family methyltransferase
VTYRFADVQGFGGGFSCGATLAGFRLNAKREKPGGFGIPLMEANRAFLGDAWDSQASEPEAWDVPSGHTDVVIGTPPCSAFSGMTAGYAAHGMDSSINDCMHDLVRFAARVRPAAMIMESVSQAFTNGQVLMNRLWQELEKWSGLKYFCYHIIQDNYSLGGVTRRKRYFLVLTQLPFGVEVPELKWLPTFRDAVGDLRDLPLRWEAQNLTSSPTWWSHHLRAADGTVDGHSIVENSYTRRQMSLVSREVTWDEGEKEAAVLKKYYEKYGELPEEFRYEAAGIHKGLTRDKVLIDRGLDPGGFSQPYCWPWDQPGRVVNGAGPYMVWHPDGRLATNREVARILGFPDSWLCGSLKDDPKLHAYWGKGTSVSPAEWVMSWLRSSFDGEPGGVTGTELPDGSHLIDVSRHWKNVTAKLASPPPPLVVKAPSELNMAQVMLKQAVSKPSTPVKPAKEKAPVKAAVKSHKAPKPAVIVPPGFTYRPEDDFCVREVFEGQVYRKLLIRPGDRVLDLGGHIGSFTVWACRQGAGHVTAVEMMPDTAKLLRENTRGLPVAVVEAAISDTPGGVVALMSKRGNPMGASVMGTRYAFPTGRHSERSVASITLPELLENAPSLIKFDIEGSEYRVLAPHATDLAASGVRQLIGEHHVQTERLLEESRKLYEALTAAGYVASRLPPSRVSGWGTVICYSLT